MKTGDLVTCACEVRHERQRSGNPLRLQLLGKREAFLAAVATDTGGICPLRRRQLRLDPQHPGPYDERRRRLSGPLRRTEAWRSAETGRVFHAGIDHRLLGNAGAKPARLSDWTQRIRRIA